jgi:hypothetical protein
MKIEDVIMLLLLHQQQEDDDEAKHTRYKKNYIKHLSFFHHTGQMMLEDGWVRICRLPGSPVGEYVRCCGTKMKFVCYPPKQVEAP